MVPVPASKPSSGSSAGHAEEIPAALLSELLVKLEEGLYPNAFAQLSSLLNSGNYSAASFPARVPPHQIIALAATLSVHPRLTTRARDGETMKNADSALDFLRAVEKDCGAGAAGLGLGQSLAFASAGGERAVRGQRQRGGRRGVGKPSEMSEHSAEDGFKLRNMYSDKDSIWTNAEDFWHVLGWAFNCSILHQTRWKRYLLLLDWMLNALSTDLEYNGKHGTADQSILAKYLSSVGEGRNNKRRVMRAILADGGTRSTGEFPEIWKNETKPPKRKAEDEVAQMDKKKKLDLEAGEFGDYYNDSDSDLESPATGFLPRSRSAMTLPSVKGSRNPLGDEQRSQSTAGVSSTLASFGGFDSLNLRRKTLALLVRLSQLSPATFLDTEDLFDLFTEFLRPLPLPVFQQLVITGSSPFPKDENTTRGLGVNEQSSLDQMLLRPLLASAAPAYHDDCLTQDDFETHFAPFAANTHSAIDNAKVALLLEDLLRLLWRSENLEWGEDLQTVVERGIEARREKVAFDGRRKKSQRAKEDEEAVAMIKKCGERMLVVLELAKT
ncbi:hypothetical protein KC318_g2178 [Hortaea werneckii]|uniref:Uncharacterized protein n=1 Tax=Hortaea werneckii TaxID=91943 RepID=A0A3M7B8J8_HORWE|nr:hypothetical protein KC334_g5758 [Hortaea werneckii]KAI7013540.1 hypothetical protein KC355_g4994 [Hortaea werneckii]KAI7673545.1 hypothetical protein KC318_g2178 [Hortaea werneckii]RMY20263.1 hypothetical protein D0867_04126 [Hortaea werneckii]RMY35994.1 hypothetical protein D0866_04234 [Hortaea werneckii]